MEQEIKMTRPTWEHQKFHLNEWKQKGVTVLICQRKTKDLTRLCLESLLRFYPDIPILVVDGDSRDESTIYLRHMQLKHPNIKLWEREHKNDTKHTSHGVTMHEAIEQHITSKYVLLLDNDTIIERGGFVEGMLAQFKEDKNLYANGSLMLVSRSNDACGVPKDENDVLRYAHPSCSMYHVKKYFKFRPFCDHGAPCCYNMQDAEKEGMKVGYYPVDKFVSHLSGASWTEPSTIWPHDHDVIKRPFLTFIIDYRTCFNDHLQHIQLQADHDFEIITVTEPEAHKVILHEHQVEVDTSKNSLYPIRFVANGEYICDIRNWNAPIQPEFVTAVKDSASKTTTDEIVVGGLLCVKRKIWQRKIII